MTNDETDTIDKLKENNVNPNTFKKQFPIVYQAICDNKLPKNISIDKGNECFPKHTDTFYPKVIGHEPGVGFAFIVNQETSWSRDYSGGTEVFFNVYAFQKKGLLSKEKLLGAHRLQARDKWNPNKDEPRNWITGIEEIVKDGNKVRVIVTTRSGNRPFSYKVKN